MRNPRLASILVCFLAVASLAKADDAALKKLVKEKVVMLGDATAKGEYGKVADLTHTRVLQLMGGRENMIAQTEAATKQMKAEGMEIKAFKVGEPSDIVRQGNDLYITVPNELTIKMKGARIVASGYVVGVSYDKGKTWSFINSDSKGSIKKVFPDLPTALKLPEVKKPVIEKD